MNQNQGQGQQRQYNEVAAGGSDNQRWEPTKNETNPNYPKQIEGYFKKFTELPGTNGPFMVAEIQMMNPDGTLGACVDVSGGKVLENKLREIPLSTWVMIQYLGKVKGKANMYNDWKTFTDDNAVPLHQLLGLPAPMQNNAFGGGQQNNQAPAQNNGFGQGQPQQNNNAFGNAPAFGQPAQNNNAPVFNGGAPAQNNNAFGQGQPQQNNQAPAFNTNAPAQNTGGNGTWNPPPAQNNAPAFNNAPVQNAPAQNNGFGQGQPQQNNGFPAQNNNGAPANPFQQQNDDLPF